MGRGAVVVCGRGEYPQRVLGVGCRGCVAGDISPGDRLAMVAFGVAVLKTSTC
jgi:hypothetical protein